VLAYLRKACVLPWYVTPLKGFSSSFCRVNISIFGMARTLFHLLRFCVLWLFGENIMFRILFWSSASFSSCSSSRVNTCAFARLSTAIAKKTFSRVSVFYFFINKLRRETFAFLWKSLFKRKKTISKNITHAHIMKYYPVRNLKWLSLLSGFKPLSAKWLACATWKHVMSESEIEKR